MEKWAKSLKWVTWSAAIVSGALWIPLPDGTGVPQDLRMPATVLIVAVVVICMWATLVFSSGNHKRLWLGLTGVSFIISLCVTVSHFWASHQWLCEVKSIGRTFVIGSELHDEIGKRIEKEEARTRTRVPCEQILTDTAEQDIRPEYAWKVDGIERHRNILTALYFALIPVAVVFLSSGAQLTLCLRRPGVVPLPIVGTDTVSSPHTITEPLPGKAPARGGGADIIAPTHFAHDFTVFISYAHSDNESSDPNERWLNRLLEFLKPLVMQGHVGTWADTEIKAGENWQEYIQTQLQKAKVAVLLLSPAFLASEYIRNNELPILLMKAKTELGVTVLPIILRPCMFSDTEFEYLNPANGQIEKIPLSVFQAANPPDKPLNSMKQHEQDEVLLSIARRIQTLARQNTFREELPGAS